MRKRGSSHIDVSPHDVDVSPLLLLDKSSLGLHGCSAEPASGTYSIPSSSVFRETIILKTLDETLKFSFPSFKPKPLIDKMTRNAAPPDYCKSTPRPRSSPRHCFEDETSLHLGAEHNLLSQCTLCRCHSRGFRESLGSTNSRCLQAVCSPFQFPAMFGD